MNQCEWLHQDSKVCVQWNDALQIKRVDVQLSNDSDHEKIENGMICKGRVSSVLFRLFEQIEEYLDHGTPIQKPDWNLFDESVVTPFQKSVYDATCHIPHGETRTYGWIAMRIGKPLAQRAVGQALGKNPFPILFPCHRVIRSCGNVGGFKGEASETSSEVNLKKFLLEKENLYRNPTFSFFNELA